MKKIIGAIIGAILGLPLSFYFQTEMIQRKAGGIGGYINKFGDVINSKELFSNVIVSVIVFTIIGFFLGYFMDKNESQKKD